MLPSILFLAASAIGVSYGYEPIPEGGMQYIVQFEPEELREAENAGVHLDSDIPSKVGDVRSISIRLGNTVLPQKLGPPSTPKTNEPAEPSKEAPATDKEKETTAAGESGKPWMTLIVVAILLVVSVAGNVYLLWIYAELRRRYRAALASAS